MKLSELIKKLEEKKENIGDVQVFVVHGALSFDSINVRAMQLNEDGTDRFVVAVVGED